jgi:hypothetical protein
MATASSRSVLCAKFTRPADTTAYASGDLVANSTTAGSVAPMTFAFASLSANGSINIRRVRVNKSGATVTNASFRVHMFNVLPTVSSGDNAAIAIATGAAGYIGQVDVTVSQTFTDGASGATTCDLITLPVAGGNDIYGLVEARGAYTPASAEVITVKLEVIQD